MDNRNVFSQKDRLIDLKDPVARIQIAGNTMLGPPVGDRVGSNSIPWCFLKVMDALNSEIKRNRNNYRQ